MLTPEQVAAIRDRANDLTKPITDYLLQDIARRISEAGQLTGSASYQIYRAQQLGMSRKEIEKELKRLLKVSEGELKTLLTQSAEVGYRFDLSQFGEEAVPFEENEVIQQIVEASVQLATDDFKNITQTLGMVDPFGNVLPLQETYQKCMDFAFEQVATGATDYSTAIRNAVKNLTKYGIRSIDYESGVHRSLEAAARGCVMGGLGLMQEKISQQNHDDMGADGWEISAHAASAPDHEPIQGKQYTDKEYTALNNSLIRRIGTLNCGHAAYPIIMGVSDPQYTEEELEQFRLQNEEGVTFEGKHYTMYEATQTQRRLERAMRTQKRKILVDEAIKDDERLLYDQIRLRRINEEYVRFSRATGLPTQTERAQSGGFSKKNGLRAYYETEKEFKKVIEKAKKGDIIKPGELSDDMVGIIAGKEREKLLPLVHKLPDRAVRKWYIVQNGKIPQRIDKSLPLEDQARMAHKMRNDNRTFARDLMSDQKKRKVLDEKEPNISFEDFVSLKMEEKGMTKDEVYRYILGSAQRTRKSVNKTLGLG